MPSDELQERRGFNDLLADLSDSDIVIEVAAGNSGRRTPDVTHLRLLEQAVEASYQALAGAVELKLESVAVLEEVTRSSRSLWLRIKDYGTNSATPAHEISQLKFLARGTLAMIAWMDGSPTLQLADLQQAIRVLAWGTSVTTAAQPVLPSSAALVKAITAWQQAKADLTGGETVRIITTNGSATLDPAKLIADPRTLLLTRKLINHSAEIIFIVEMPDYQATGQWQLKHGANRTLAHCEPGTLLDQFYRRELDVRPGDALRCRVDLETSYGPDHEVLAERYRIVEIVEFLPVTRGESGPAAPTFERIPARRTNEELATVAH